MSRELPQITLQQRQMMMTVIWLALIMGVVTFGIIVILIGQNKEPGKGLPVITYLGMSLAALMLVLRMIIPNLIARNQFAQAMQEAREEEHQDEEQVLGTFYQIFMVRMIIGLALLEGAAMLNLVAMIIENQKLAFIPVVILLLVMIASMPTKSKLDGWIRNQMENYNLEHQN